MAQFQFSTDGIDTTNKFDALPKGDYTAIVVASEFKPTRSGTGTYLALELDVQAPEAYRGRKLWDNLNLDNPSAKAVQIAKTQMAQLCKACGFEGITDTSQLHDIPVIAMVRLDKDDNTRNVIKGYKAAGAQPAAAPAPTPAPMQPTPQATPPAPPVASAPVQTPAQAAQQSAAIAPPWLNQAQ